MTPASRTADPVDGARGPGRPRDEDIDDTILTATLALIDAEENVTVSQIVARSGVSKAALYRRWPSVTTLIAAALDVGRVVPAPLPVDGDLHDALFDLILGGIETATSPIPEARLRRRMELVMADRALQKAYWSSHVSVRRRPMEAALRAGIDRGVLRSDIDVEAAYDAIAGVFYYQFVARGDSVGDAAVQARLRGAWDIIWRGMQSDR